jgi:hypothetical protein
MMAKFQNGDRPFYRISASFDYSEASAAQDFAAQNGIPRFYMGGPIVWTGENHGFYPTIEIEVGDLPPPRSTL